MRFLCTEDTFSLSCKCLIHNTQYFAFYLRTKSFFYFYHEWFWFITDAFSQRPANRARGQVICWRQADPTAWPPWLQTLAKSAVAQNPPQTRRWVPFTDPPSHSTWAGTASHQVRFQHISLDLHLYDLVPLDENDFISLITVLRTKV